MSKRLDDPGKVGVVEEDYPYVFGKRTVRAFFTAGLLLLALGTFVFWYFSGNDNEAAPDEIVAGQIYTEESGRNVFYRFLSSFFEDVAEEDGAPDVPDIPAVPPTATQAQDAAPLPRQTQEQAQADPDRILTGRTGRRETLAEQAPEFALNAETAARIAPEAGTSYMHSLDDVLGGAVRDTQGDLTGEIYDILIDPETGEARILVFDRSVDIGTAEEVAAVDFDRIRENEEEGTVSVTVPEEPATPRPEFRYEDIVNQDYVSLRGLQAGRVLDFEGRSVGAVSAVTYEDGRAQEIYFRIDVPGENSRFFRLPFEGVDVGLTPSGFDMLLDRVQTEQIARYFFE